MKNLKSILLVIGCVAALGLSTGKVAAQGRPNFDPAQIRQNMLDRYKEQMGVTDEGEWKVLEAAIGKVMDAQREAMAGMFGGMRGNRGGGSSSSSTNSTDSASQGGRRRGGGFFGAPSAESEELQKAIDAKAPSDEIKAKLAKLRDSNAAKEANLASAREELKKLLTSKQEAIAVLGGLLK